MKCFFCGEDIENVIEHYFKITVENAGGDDHKEKRFMCYNCESGLRHRTLNMYKKDVSKQKEESQ